VTAGISIDSVAKTFVKLLLNISVKTQLILVYFTDKILSKLCTSREKCHYTT